MPTASEEALAHSCQLEDTISSGGGRVLQSRSRSHTDMTQKALAVALAVAPAEKE
ncbi:Hypothetical predicted protein, partial [Marmota monax]